MKLCMGCMNQMEDQITVCPHCGFNERELKQEGYYLTPGTVVGGKYIIGRALSYGGYTVTYIGMDAENNRKVLIKEYLPNDFSTRSEGDREVTIYSGDAKEQFEEGLTTFLNEANRIQQLGRPQGIMQVYDCVAENDTGYVISEYLEGQTLAQIFEGGKKFSPQEAKEFICEILEGLRRVHPLDVVHCDIAPETILVTRTGEIKLLDFGATRYVTTANSKSLAIILKQGYAPEEQYRSQGIRGPWTDVYALGAVMYHMITGIVPIESVDRALVDELKTPSLLGVPMPKNMENALMNALNVYQKDRTPSAEVFYQELNNDEVKRIQVKKKKYETGRFPKWAKALVAGLLCVVVAGGVFVVYKIKQENNHEGKSETKIADNLIGMSEKDANELLKSKGIKFISNKVFFDKNVENGSEILTQKPASGEEVKDDVIRGAVRSKEKCTYQDIADMKDSVETLIATLEIDKSKLVPSKESDTKRLFKSLYAINLNNGEKITYDFLEKSIKEGNDLKKAIVDISDIESITYYISPFLQVKRLKNYKGDNVNKVRLPQYSEINGKVEMVGKIKPSSNACYYSLEEEKGVGFIVNQTVDPGQKYDSRYDSDALFETVKENIGDQNEGANELIKKIQEVNKKVIVKNEDGENKIEKIEINGDEKCRVFTRDDNIVIYKKKKSVQPKSKNIDNQSEGTRGTKPGDNLN